jgi:type VI secretion system protein ImpL
MIQGEAAQEAHVEAAQRRLTELNRELGIQLPVYLVVTKCDLVAGFTEYFDDLSHDGRKQVWGVTFPYEQTVSNEAPQQVPEQFDALITRLNERVFERVEDVRDVRRRTRIFAFPQQFAALRDPLTRFVTEVFAATRFDRQILLRGVYFTSGTQDGTPIDRLLSGIGRRFGVAAEAIVPTSGPGKAYFVERLLREVLLPESGLAGVNRRLEARKAAVQLGSYAAVAAVAVLGVVLWSISYARNRAYLDQAATDVAAIKKLPLAAPTAPLDALRPRLDALAALVQSADRRDKPWSMRWGLFQGDAIGDAARDAYARELDGTLLPRVAAQIQRRLVEYARRPEDLYVYFKAYLMFREPEHLDKAHLKQMADLEWADPRVAAAETGRAMSAHFGSLLDYKETLRPLSLDEQLIAQVRSSIRQASMARIMYSGVKTKYAKDSRSVDVAAQAGLNTDRVFKRKSGATLIVPALFGRTVFEEVTGRERAALTRQLEEDRWVWGEANAALGDPATISAEVTALYEQEYAAAWDEFLEDLEFASFPTIGETTEALRIVASSTSPLRGLVRIVTDNTNLVQPAGAAPTAGLVEQLKAKASQTFKTTVGRAIGASAVTPGLIVAARFESIHRLMVGEEDKRPIEAILAIIRDIEAQLGKLGPDIAAANSVKALSDPELRRLLLSLQQQAEGLPDNIGRLIFDIGSKALDAVNVNASERIRTNYQQQVLPSCNQLIANRYPFERGTTADVTLADFGKVFGTDGIFHKFFKEFLAEQVDTSAQVWKLRPGAAGVSRGILDQFADAERLREMFFVSSGDRPSLRFSVVASNLDADSSRFVLHVDDSSAETKPAVATRSTLEWPGKTGQANAYFEDRRFRAETAFEMSGPWALFRMIDNNGRPPLDAQGRLLLEIANPYHRVEVRLEPPGARTNPFDADWRRFSCSVS